MALPKVKFVKMSVEENLDNLVWYAKRENSEGTPLDFYKFTLRLFPNLEGKLKQDMNDEEIYMVLDKYVRPTLEDLYENSSEPEEYQRIWDRVNDEVMLDLESKLDFKWNCDEVVCRLCLLPVCSRDILGKTYDIRYGVDQDEVIATGIHELCHFLYYEKWMEMFPNFSEEELDNPHIAWYLSEAMIDPLINNDTFKKYTSDDLSAYTYFYDIDIAGESLIEILRSYIRDFSVEEAIRLGYKLFLANEDKIKGK